MNYTDVTYATDSYAFAKNVRFTDINTVTCPEICFSNHKFLKRYFTHIILFKFTPNYKVLFH